VNYQLKKYLRPEKRISEKQVKTFLDIVILAILNGEPTYGYKIIATIHKEFGVLLSPGSLYPLLHFLEENKLIESHSRKGKTVYQATPKGKEDFKRLLAAYNASYKKIANFVRCDRVSPFVGVY
jgi:DNA-binding PadR family transcriptional regulator